MSKTSKNPAPVKRAPPAGGKLMEIPLSKLKPHPENPRGEISERDPAVVELSASIRSHGLIQPITATEKFEIIGGHRRRVAAKLAGLVKVPVIVYKVDAAAAGEMRVVENLQREDLPPIEEAKGVAALLAAGRTPAEIADRLGKPLSWVVRRAKITELSPKWKKLATQKDSPLAGWSGQMLEEVAALPRAQQDELLASTYNEGEGLEDLQLAGLRGLVAEYRRALETAPFDIRDESLVPKAGSCLTCPKRASCTPGLFAEVGAVEDGKLPKNDLCLDADCFNRKRSARLQRAVQETGAGKVIITGVGWSEKRDLPEDLSALCGDAYGLERCTKGAPDAFVAAIEAETLKVTWYKKRARQGAKKAASAGDAKDGPAMRSLEDRRAGLLKRRLAWAVDHLAETIRSEECPMPGPTAVIGFSAVFGLPDLEEIPGAMANLSAAESRDIAIAMWPGLRSRMDNQLNGWRVDGPDSRAALLAAWVAAHAYEGGWDRILARAATEIPEPKSWAKLETTKNVEASVAAAG